MVVVEGTDWAEPVLWISICMLRTLVKRASSQCGLGDSDCVWLLDDQSFEKMGESMYQNHSKLLGLYDKLSTFLTQINVCRGRGVTESHGVSLFLQLYGGDPWVRKTGKKKFTSIIRHLQGTCLCTLASFHVIHDSKAIPMHACGLLIDPHATIYRVQRTSAIFRAF